MERRRPPAAQGAAPDGQEPTVGAAPPASDPDQGSDALRAALQAAGLQVAPQEMPRLLRQLGGRASVPEAALRRALLDVRRRAWRERLAVLAGRAGALPATPADFDLAVTAVEDPATDDAGLLAALREVVLVRLSGYGTPSTALDAALQELPKRNSGEAGLEAVEHCAALVAEAFALTPADAAAFARRAVETERRRRGERREATRAARETRAEEERRLKAWEASLIGAGGVSALLGCSAEEAERWIRAGLVPVARRVAVRRGGRTTREAEFDPAVLERLREAVPTWRRGPAARPAESQRDGRQEGRGASNAAVARVAGLDRYAGHFATARALDRRLVACLGPTNSGKTYFGLSRLAGAESGIILGPLRLLAHEYREALEGQGIPTALSTGEERTVVPGSRHTAATVEMCPFRTPVDVAVIDEAQMLADPERGPAWTAAIMGVPARTVIILGAPDAAPMIRRIAELCGDPLEEVRLERMGPLAAAPQPVPFAEIGRGDAVIAFSRREVFELRAELLRRGRAWPWCTARSAPRSGGRRRGGSARARRRCWWRPMRSAWG
jgi:ATP-dependent RNA helicase SUPV3L1/SUV3